MHVQAKRICYITPDIFLESAEDKLVILFTLWPFADIEGQEFSWQSLTKKTNTKQHSCYQDILFLHPEIFSVSNAASLYSSSQNVPHNHAKLVNNGTYEDKLIYEIST
jgi:hypothetical protein